MHGCTFENMMIINRAKKTDGSLILNKTTKFPTLITHIYFEQIAELWNMFLHVFFTYIFLRQCLPYDYLTNRWIIFFYCLKYKFSLRNNVNVSRNFIVANINISLTLYLYIQLFVFSSTFVIGSGSFETGYWNLMKCQLHSSASYCFH